MTTPHAKGDHKSDDRPDRKADVKTSRADAEDAKVVQFLAGHPDFFERHHVLREKNRELEMRLRALVENGHANDQLAEKIHRLSKRLIHARDLHTRVAAVEASLREDFDVREFVIVLTNADPSLTRNEARYLRVARTDDPGMRSFESLFASGKPRCGRIRDSQRDWLFPSATVEVGSVALVPLGAGGGLGLLAIASADADHFNPTMSTDFLARIGELVATALE
jgi:uncharacterized protein YigA (DUF484 family)